MHACNDNMPPATRIVPENNVGRGVELEYTDIVRMENAARGLEQSGEYRILRRLKPRRVYPDRLPVAGDGTRIGIVVDTETTGLDPSTDEVIELAMIAFTFDDRRIHDVVGIYEGLRQPTRPLTEEVSKLTGITAADLAGRSLDLSEIERFVEDAAIIIAHNASFDRAFCEALSPVFASKPWACSAAEIDWRSLGVEGAKLFYVLGAFGLFHGAHRAIADCWALLEILDGDPPIGGGTVFRRLLTSSAAASVEIAAEGAPFRSKDVLKRRGYKWSDGSDGRPKAWRTTVAEDAADSEIVFLKTEVYGSDREPVTTLLDAFTRYRGRVRAFRTFDEKRNLRD